MTLQRAAFVTEAQLSDEPHLPPLVESLAEITAELADPVLLALGLRAGTRLVAAVRLRPADNGVVELGRLCVAPDLQGQGLGSRLLRESEEALPEAREIRLFTGSLSAANLRLYERHGYRRTHIQPLGRHELVHLAKDLSLP